MLVDGLRQQITFRVSYTSAIVTGFTILVVVALAYVVGRQMSRGPAQAMGGPSSEQLRQGPANPQVLDIAGTSTPERTVSPPAGGARPSTATPVVPTRSPTTAPSGKRIMSMNYVIIQGYPDEASAKAAVQILQEHGVGSTIEKGIRGLKSDWFIVVGTDGFVKVSGRDYETYITRIQQISDKFAGSRRSFKAFEPLPYKWDRP
jgi:hypothetical protein